MKKSNASLVSRFAQKPRAKGLGLRVLSLSDQVMFSGANFILMLILTKYYSDMQVAGFGIGLSIALIIQSVQRTCYVVQSSLLAPSLFRRRVNKILGEHLVAWGLILLAESVIAAALYVIAPSPYHASIFVSTIVCSLIYAQLDFDRIVLIKHEKYVDPFIASAAFLALTVALFFLIPRLGISYAVTMTLVGSYAALKIARLFLLVGKPDPVWGWRLFKSDYRKYLWGSLIGTASYAGYNHIPLFILGNIAAPLETAAFVAMRGLMQPLQVVLRSLDVIDKNLFNPSAHAGHRALRRILLKQLGIYGGLSVLAIAGVAVVGQFFLHLIYGDKYTAFFDVLVGWSAISALLAITYPLETVLIRLKKLSAYNYLRFTAGFAGVALAVYLCPAYGAIGAVGACLGGWIVSILCALWLTREVLTASDASAALQEIVKPERGTQ